MGCRNYDNISGFVWIDIMGEDCRNTARVSSDSYRNDIPFWLTRSMGTSVPSAISIKAPLVKQTVAGGVCLGGSGHHIGWIERFVAAGRKCHEMASQWRQR
jgi:hypothetical protein